MTKTFTLHRSNGVRDSPCFQNDGMEGEEEKGLGQKLPAVGQRRGDLAGCRGGTAGVADRKERRRNVLERERERIMGVGVGWERRKELGRGPENEIDRRKWAPQPSQNWQKTTQFSKSGTAGHNGRHCRPANFAGITLKLYDLLHLIYGYIFSKYHDQ